MPDGSQPLLFNVSHQAGLVVMLAVHNPPAGLAIGVDIVSPFERRARDHESIAADGWSPFVDMHAEVFCPREVTSLKQLPVTNSLDRPLRYFYALWCLREAYVKMTGDALLAPWLGELEMRNFAPPEDMEGTQQDVWFKGQRVENVLLKIQDLMGEYMVSTAVKAGEGGEGVELGEFWGLRMDDILEFGERADH